MATIQRFEELDIWKLAFELYKTVSPITLKMKQNHDYRFADQMKSAAGSIMDNIDEGFGRKSRLEFVNALGIAGGESCELKSQTHRCLFDKYITIDEFNTICIKIERLVGKITNLVVYLNQSPIKGQKFKNRRIL